jgi:hypothetical protein
LGLKDVSNMPIWIMFGLVQPQVENLTNFAHQLLPFLGYNETLILLRTFLMIFDDILAWWYRISQDFSLG